jgi:hypothetical protein
MGKHINTTCQFISSTYDEIKHKNKVTMYFATLHDQAREHGIAVFDYGKTPSRIYLLIQARRTRGRVDG